MAVRVVALVSVTPGEDDGFAAAARACVAASWAEPGVLHYDLWRETDGEGRFVFNQLYADDAAVQAHMASDRFNAFGPAARELASTRPTIVVTYPVDVA